MERKDFIIELVSRLSEVKGKKALQKLIYLCKAFHISTGYNFRFHYYGPYSDSLANDFEQLLESNLISLKPGSHFVYSIQYTDNWKTKLNEDDAGKLTKLIKLFGEMSPSDLEIYATAYFVHWNEKHVFNNIDEFSIIEKIKNAKPRYAGKYIMEIYQQLKEWNLIEDLRSVRHPA